MRRYLIVVFTFISYLGFSQEWEKIASSDDGIETFIRLHSKNSAWIKTTFVLEPEKGYEMILYRFDCDNLKLGVLAAVQYNKEGEVVKSMQTKEILVDMEYPIPDSYGEFYLKTFCASDN